MLEFCRREWTSLLTALAFLTRLGPARCLDAAALSRAVRYYPVAGLAAGVAQTLPAAVLMLAHPAWGAGAAWLYVAAGFAVTRGLHWDAVADMGDAWGSGASGPAFWRILKDSRMGAYGAMSLLLTFSLELLCAAVLCAAADWGALCLAPAWGRACGVILAGSAAPHAAGSLGALACTGAGGAVRAFWLALGLCAAVLLLPPVPAVSLVLASLALAGGLHRLARRQGGLNGDFLGAAMLWGECLALCAACL